MFGPHRLKVDRKALERHPGIENHMNRDLVIGIRPGDFEDATGGRRRRRTGPWTVEVEVTEVLGSETFVHYSSWRCRRWSPPRSRSCWPTRVAMRRRWVTPPSSPHGSPPTSPCTRETRLDLVVDTAKFHFFDPETGQRIGR